MRNGRGKRNIVDKPGFAQPSIESPLASRVVILSWFDMNTALCTLFLLVFPFVCAAQWTENPDIAALFRHANVDGTFVVFNTRTGAMAGYNETRAKTRFVPASTFKIAHTLIGVASGAVANVDEVLAYGGRAQPYKAWERDMSLRAAIAISNVAIYQTLARRIGVEDMERYVRRLEYGNMRVGDTVTRFWLDGPLRISAVEQTAFLARLAAKHLPLPAQVQAQVHEIILHANGEGWRLWAKSGWEHAPGAGVGWWVGWVRVAGVDHAFALNMEMRNPAMAPLRESLGKASLQAAGLLH